MSHGGRKARQAVLFAPVKRGSSCKELLLFSGLLVVASACATSSASELAEASVSKRIPHRKPFLEKPLVITEEEDAESEALVLAREVLTARAPKLNATQRDAVAELLWKAEQEHGLPVLLLLGLIEQESRFQPRARGPRGALGLMQIRPFVAADVAKRNDIPWNGYSTLYDPVANVRIGVAYLAEQHVEFGEAQLALAAYNVGPTRLRRLLRAGKGRRGPYVRRVLAKAEALRAEFTPSDAASASGG